jgi:hypothetical protein
MNPLPCLCTPQKHLMASTNSFPCCSTQKENQMTKKNQIGLFNLRPARPSRVFRKKREFWRFFGAFFKKSRFFDCPKNTRFFQVKIGVPKKSRFCRFLAFNRRFLLLGLREDLCIAIALSTRSIPLEHIFQIDFQGLNVQIDISVEHIPFLAGSLHSILSRFLGIHVTCNPSRRNRRLIGKNRKKRDFLGLPIFSKKKNSRFFG